MKFKPLQDRVIIKRLEEEEKTKGGIIIPDAAKEKPQEGRVVAVGQRQDDGEGTESSARGEGGRQDPLRQVLGNGDQN